jgi:hypothetical protein
MILLRNECPADGHNCHVSGNAGGHTRTDIAHPVASPEHKHLERAEVETNRR